VAKRSGAEKAQNGIDLASPVGKFLGWNILRKFEQSLAYYCQYSEYLTLLNSFPDVKKSDEGASHEH